MHPPISDMVGRPATPRSSLELKRGRQPVKFTGGNFISDCSDYSTPIPPAPPAEAPVAAATAATTLLEGKKLHTAYQFSWS